MTGTKDKVIKVLTVLSIILFSILFTLCILSPFVMIFTGMVDLRTGLDYQLSIRGY